MRERIWRTSCQSLMEQPVRARRRPRRGEQGFTLLELLVTAVLGVLVVSLGGLLLDNSQTYANRQAATSQLLAIAASSLNQAVDSMDNAQPLGYCTSTQQPYSTPYDQCSHVSELGSSLWAASSTGVCWFAYLAPLQAGQVDNPNLQSGAPNLQCLYAVPYVGPGPDGGQVTAAQDQYDLWLVAWPAQGIGGAAPTYTNCQPQPGIAPAGCWSDSGLQVGQLPQAAPECAGGSAQCPTLAQLLARVYIPPDQPLLRYYSAADCPLGTQSAPSGCTPQPLPDSSSCVTDPPASGAPWSGCLSVLQQVVSINLDLHLRAVAVVGNYGIAGAGPAQGNPGVLAARGPLGTVDQQLQLLATLYGQSYLQQQSVGQLSAAYTIREPDAHASVH